MMKIIPLVLAAILGGLVLTACNPAQPVFLRQPPDDSGDAAGTIDGPYGVAVVERDFRVRLDETVNTRIYLPADSANTLAEGPFPTMLFVHGGLVRAERYSWFIEYVTARGYVVVAPAHRFDLPIFATGNSADILEALRRANEESGDILHNKMADTPAIAAGHSLGGVVAIKTWLTDPEAISHLLLLQSIPDSNDDDRLADAPVDDIDILAIAGGRDGRITAETIADELTLFGRAIPLAVVEGLNHFQLVDGPAPARYEDDRPATIATGEGRQKVLALTELMLQSHTDIAGGDGGIDEDRAYGDPANWPPGVTEGDEFLEGQ